MIPDSGRVRHCLASALLATATLAGWPGSAPARATDGLDDGAGSGGRVAFDLGADLADQARACAAQSDGRAILAGQASDDDGEGSKIVLAARALTGDSANLSDVGVARLGADMELDPSFGGSGTGKRVFGMATPPPGDGDDAVGCLVLAAGRPVVVGWAEYLGLDSDFASRRLANSLIFADGFESGWTFFLVGRVSPVRRALRRFACWEGASSSIGRRMWVDHGRAATPGRAGVGRDHRPAARRRRR